MHRWVAAYFEGTRSMDAERWASAFAPDAVLDDPVGFPVKETPEDILAQGQGFVRAFQEVGLYESYVHVVGNEAVAKWQGRGTTPDGVEVTFDGINHFTFNEDGQITLLRGFALLPNFQAVPFVAAGQLAPTLRGRSHPPVEVHAVLASRRLVSPTVRAFIETARNAFPDS